MTSREIVLDVRGLQVEFRTRRGIGRAVNGASFSLHQGETLGLVGESGSGKTVTAMSIIGLHPQPAARIVGGQILFRGRDLATLPAGDLRRLRGKSIGLIPQDPMTSLNPVFSIGRQLLESLRLHTNLTGSALVERAVQILSQLHIASAEQRLKSYPHQLSGGMRQRVVGAIAIAGEPEVLIADEPTTALDATVQAAYLQLLREIQSEMGTAILFITHDFGVVAELCHAVAVMYAGYVVETAPTARIFTSPGHPYTRALITSVPDLDVLPERLTSIAGQPPSIYSLPPGCSFHSRCWLYEAIGSPERCRTEVPVLREIADGQRAACHFAERTSTAVMPAAAKDAVVERQAAS